MHAGGVNRLDSVFPGFNFLVDVIELNLGVFDNTSDLKFVHSESDWEDLGLVVPDKSVKFDFLDLLEESEEIFFLFVDLDIKNNNGFGNSFLFGWLFRFS